jgi:hypothetical protein
VIGRRAIDRAAEEALAQGGGDWSHGLAACGFDLHIVEEYSERAVGAFDLRGLEPDEAIKAGFRLGLQLGYRIAASQSKGRQP